MKNTAKKSKKEGRIVNVASAAHDFSYAQGILFDKINDKESYNRLHAYGQSKLANILHANELAKRLKGAATTCYVALHPQVKGVSGEYFSDNNMATNTTTSLAKDYVLAKKLWEFSLDLTNPK
ncbi:hypothetical protein HAX54_033099 [Datura stramonium]|uniref:Uncharacterized protein n=1 Tax=Datura stramonium TaxID=4076 RepID=A0ABS8VCS5_DATST|nr:hypothetical protein [Datura stramonium]